MNSEDFDLSKLQKSAYKILERVINSMKDSRGTVHPQSLICALGSLAGYSCQQDVREEYVKAKGIEQQTAFMIIRDKQGRKYFFGDLLNEPLVNAKYSVWAFAAGAAKKSGAVPADINDIFRYVSYTVGSERFGKVRSCQTGNNMFEYVKNFYSPLEKIAKESAKTGQLHIVFSIGLQKAMAKCEGVYNMTEICRIAMESAVSMSKIDIENISSYYI